MRSLLFVPGDDDKKLARALATDADALIFDLEDSVAARTVSPSNSGAGNRTSVIPKLAIVVPTVVSLTEMPIIRPRVNSEFISGRPHSVSVAQKYASI